MDNVFSTLWGLIAFAGFVTALLIPKTEEYRARSQESVEDADREIAARWSSAVRAIPVAVTAGVLIVVVASVATAHWGAHVLAQMNFWLLVVSVLAQVGFTLTVRYLVARVPAAFPRIEPIEINNKRDLCSKGGGAKVSIRFDNDTDQELILCWINYQGSLDPKRRWTLPQNDHDQNMKRETYARHLWQISTKAGEVVAIFDAPGEAAVAVVTPSMFRSSLPPSPITS